MIPLLLKMRNFICYRGDVPPINFSGMHVVCLCGDNGSGKSSIFDAITWALWGKASRGKNDDLISQGKNDMEVELEFENDKQRYRIIRKYQRSPRSKSGQVMLDFQLLDNGRFRSISEHSATATQEKINRILHLDYDTFINSAMLLQGKSNAFSIKIPSERKEILSRILGLSFYDELEADAKNAAQQNKLEYKNLEKDIENIDLRLKERPVIEQNLLQIEEELKVVEKDINIMEVELKEKRSKMEFLHAREEQLKQLDGQLNSKKAYIKNLQDKLSHSQEKIAHFNTVIKHREEIERGYLNYKQLVAAEEKQNEKLKKFNHLIQEKNKIASIIKQESSKLESERDILATRITELEKQCKQQEILMQRKSLLINQQQKLTRVMEELDKKKELLKQKNEMAIAISTTNAQLSSKKEEVQNKLKMISRSSAVCPLCERDLEIKDRERIEQKLHIELHTCSDKIKQNLQNLAMINNEIRKLDNEIHETERVLKTKIDKTGQEIALVNRELLEMEKTANEMTAVKARITQIENQLTNSSFASNEQNLLAAIEQEIQILDYDATIHDRISRERENAVQFDQLQRELNEALLLMEAEKHTEDEIKISISGIQKDIDFIVNSMESIREGLKDVPSLKQSLKEVELKMKNIRDREKEIRDKRTRLKENIHQLDMLLKEKEEKFKRLLSLQDEEGILNELAQYFSKKGIQARIIEEALPEIEYEANELLRKMSDNRMSLKLETQKPTLKGEVRETLDIEISDELGSRNYEMYSGGEAFRIDLALRIAISRLLVRRAEASMPILIVDEGFGTQDSTGLGKLIEAINSIQQDFEKIFVITHLEELKDKFPVIMNVVKTSEGSVISIS